MIALVVACSSPQGLWRDQFVFIGDDGTVLPLTLQRRSGGLAEAKGWLGQGGRWRATFYDQFSLDGASPADAETVLAAWSRAPARPARASLDRARGGVDLRVRTPSLSLRVTAPALTSLGDSEDPEGESHYRAGRARLESDGRAQDGWLVVEETPRGRPRRPHVAYGDFLFLAAARAGGVVVLKRARGAPGFDRALVAGDGTARATGMVHASLAGDALAVSLPELDVQARLTVLDRSGSRGVAPGGEALVYRALLLAGDWNGVAFTIGPATEDEP